MALVPPELKPISPFVARANELTIADPVIAYWSSYYAVQLGMTLAPKDAESNTFLVELMDKLELMKVTLDKNEAVTDDIVAAAYVDNFSARIFEQADKEDRAGKSTRMTAKKFLAAANFLELLSVFGELGSEAEEKIKYSKWKASDLAKAFREGRTPIPGPVGGIEVAEGLEEQGDTSNEEEEAKAVARQLLSFDMSKEQTLEPYPKPISFHQSVNLEDERPATPKFPSFLNTPTSFPQDSTPSPPVPLDMIPPSHQTATLPLPAISPSLAFPAAVFPKPPPLQSPDTPTLPPAPTVKSYFPPVPPLIAPQPIAPISTISNLETPEMLDPSVVAKIQKHAKWAISALNYDDLETARKELRAALQLLG